MSKAGAVRPLLQRASVITVGFIVACGCPASSQMIHLKDPTPRQPDLERVYAETPGSDAVKIKNADLLNKRRSELVLRASDDLISLATELEDGLDHHPTGTSFHPEAQAAEAIEKLAKNVKEALELH